MVFEIRKMPEKHREPFRIRKYTKGDHGQSSNPSQRRFKAIQKMYPSLFNGQEKIFNNAIASMMVGALTEDTRFKDSSVKLRSDANAFILEVESAAKTDEIVPAKFEVIIPLATSPTNTSPDDRFPLPHIINQGKEDGKAKLRSIMHALVQGAETQDFKPEKHTTTDEIYNHLAKKFPYKDYKFGTQYELSLPGPQKLKLVTLLSSVTGFDLENPGYTDIDFIFGFTRNPAGQIVPSYTFKLTDTFSSKMTQLHFSDKDIYFEFKDKDNGLEIKGSVTKSDHLDSLVAVSSILEKIKKESTFKLFCKSYFFSFLT